MRPDCVLVDDDLLVHLIWKSAADSAGRTLLAFESAEELESQLDLIDRSAPLYIDSNLGDGDRGEDLARRYHDEGFSTIWLATGSSPEDFAMASEMPWLKGIVGKSPPVELRGLKTVGTPPLGSGGFLAGVDAPPPTA
jgi:hypothetical protein